MAANVTPVAKLAKEGPVAIVTLDSPPVNALSLAVRQGMVEALGDALGDPQIQAIVLICEGRTFFAGADISEFDREPESPTLWDVLAVLDGAEKPIIAALHGTPLGGGFEVALACHHRIGLPSFSCGLPEVTLGLLPAAGGSQRLPRLIGVERALEMILAGKPVDARTALDWGIVDALVDGGDLRAGAIAFARARIAEGGPLRRLRDETATLPAGQDCASFFAQVRRDKARLLAQLDAPRACVEAVEAACTLPFEQGLALERRLFEQLVDGTQARARRHVFFAERAVSRIPGLPADARASEVARIGVVGAGTMGRGIAMACLNAGMEVVLTEMSEKALESGVSAIDATYRRQVERGRITADQQTHRMGLLTGAVGLDALASCDLIVEAVFEDMAVKQRLFADLDRVAKPEAILATNTSFLDVDAIAGATRRPERVLGLHFFSPADIMRLLEVVRGATTDASVLLTGMALGKRLRKLAVAVGNCHGFVGNRILAPRQREAERLMLEGVTPWDIDRVHVAFGMPMGPFAMHDLAGLDLGWSAETSKGETVVERLCEAARRGQKTRAGYYDYDEQRRGSPSAATEAIIAAVSREKGIVPRAANDTEIWQRCTFPMINEAAHILEEGVALRSSDVDLIWINGYGWPAHTGGPLFYADTVGLDVICAELERLESIYGSDFTPAPLLRRLAAAGKGFSAL